MKRIARTVALVIVAVLGTVGAFADMPDPEKVAQVATGERTEARVSWWGFDPEDSTRFLQAAIDSRVPKLIVDNIGSAWITTCLQGVSDQEILFESGVEVLAKSGAFTGRSDALLTLNSVTNVTLRGPGATLRMRRADYAAPPYVKAEWRNVLTIRSSANINILGLTLAESGGDGIYLGSAHPSLPNRDIHIKDVICDKNYRQGISVISAENLLIEDTILRNTAGTAPAAGIDFEPNYPGERLKNCVMRNCLTENNQGNGYEFYLGSLTRDSEPVSIWIDNCRSVGDNIGTRVGTGNLTPKAVLGSLVFSGCSFETSRHQAICVTGKPAQGMGLAFDDCLVKNCSTERNFANDILLLNGVNDEQPVGGIRFERLRIQRPEAWPWIDWVDQFYSSKPVSAITGSVLIETGNQQEELILSSEWASQTFPPRFTIHVPRVQPDLTTAEVTDTAIGLCALSPVKLRRGGTYVLFAKEEQEVVLTGCPRPLNLSPLNLTLKLRSPLGELVPTATLTNSNQVVELRFNAAQEGFYTLQVDVGIHAFELLSANVPIAIDGTKGKVALIKCLGPLFVAVPQGTELFAIGVAGEGTAETVKVTILDPDHNEVWQKDSVRSIERFTLQDRQGQTNGLWQIHFAKPSEGFFEDFSVDVLGVSGYLFLHPERYWSIPVPWTNWLPHWKFRQPVTVRAEVVMADLTNFPVLVRLNAANFNFQAGKADGSDVRFVLPDGTPLAYDREQNDSVTGNAIYWVKLPLVSATQNTTFHLYYGNAFASDAANSHEVWTADYVGVWHLNEAANAATYNKKSDASSNQLYAVTRGVLDKDQAVPAIIGKGILLDGHSPTGGFLTTGFVNLDTTQGLTFSAWVKPHSIGSHFNQGDGIISIGGGSWFPYFRTTLSFYTPPADNTPTLYGHTSVWIGEATNASAVAIKTPGFTTGVWHHAVATFYCHRGEGATNTTVKIYLDGQKIGENSVEGYALRNPLGNLDRGFYFGTITNYKYPGDKPLNSTFDGILDETRIANTVRSDAWINASYLNQKAVDGLLVYGSLQQPGMCFIIQ